MEIAQKISQSLHKNAISQVLVPYKQKIEKKLLEGIHAECQKTALRDACEYAVLNGGKRFRPALVMMVAEALGGHSDVSYAALAVEFFHTASLIADDLPCMDNEDQRRNKPTLHKISGEATALLASYALIASGYGCLAKNAMEIKNANLPFSEKSDHICVLALENATYNTGLCGATGGQFLDMYPKEISLDSLMEAIHKKTVSLFEISFVFGWLFGGGEIEKIDEVKQLSWHFGTAFQIADDIDDMEEDVKNGRKINVAAAFGKNEALKLFKREIELLDISLEKLRLKTDALTAMSDLLFLQAKEFSL